MRFRYDHFERLKLNWPYRFTDVSGPSSEEVDYIEIRRWCTENFGLEGDIWLIKGWVVYIKRKDDALAFRMRWC